VATWVCAIVAVAIPGGSHRLDRRPQVTLKRRLGLGIRNQHRAGYASRIIWNFRGSRRLRWAGQLLKRIEAPHDPFDRAPATFPHLGLAKLKALAGGDTLCLNLVGNERRHVHHPPIRQAEHDAIPVAALHQCAFGPFQGNLRGYVEMKGQDVHGFF
jgi:hypothetical protein